jgi:hypothetical protein
MNLNTITIDVNGDGVVNTLDVALVARRYGWKEDP